MTSSWEGETALRWTFNAGLAPPKVRFERP